MNENARRSTGDINTRGEKGECLGSAPYLTHRRASRIANLVARTNGRAIRYSYSVFHILTLPSHGNPYSSVAAMPGRVPLMGSRRALGDIGNQLGGGLTSRNGAKDAAIKCVVVRTPRYRPLLRLLTRSCFILARE